MRSVRTQRWEPFVKASCAVRLSGGGSPGCCGNVTGLISPMFGAAGGGSKGGRPSAPMAAKLPPCRSEWLPFRSGCALWVGMRLSTGGGGICVSIVAACCCSSANGGATAAAASPAASASATAGRYTWPQLYPAAAGEGAPASKGRVLSHSATHNPKPLPSWMG